MAGAHQLGGMMNLPPEMPSAAWLPYIRWPTSTLRWRRRWSGGEILSGPMAVPGGERVAQCMDPQGAAFALHGV
ncbi:MAG: hypothetical protein R3F60_31715 [bacterium]